MTEHLDSDNIFQPNKTYSHTQIWGKTGSGKVALATPDDLSKTPDHLKINFRPNPSH